MWELVLCREFVLFFMVTNEAGSLMFVENLNKHLAPAIIGKGLPEAHPPPPLPHPIQPPAPGVSIIWTIFNDRHPSPQEATQREYAGGTVASQTQAPATQILQHGTMTISMWVMSHSLDLETAFDKAVNFAFSNQYLHS